MHQVALLHGRLAKNCFQPPTGLTWAVHGLEAEQLLLNLKVEHVVLVVVCVPTGHLQRLPWELAYDLSIGIGMRVGMGVDVMLGSMEWETIAAVGVQVLFLLQVNMSSTSCTLTSSQAMC